jgi:hypothetical protein
MDAYVEDNLGTTTVEREDSVAVNEHKCDVKHEDDNNTQNIGIDGDDGIDKKEDDSSDDGIKINDDKDLDDSSITDISCPSSADDHNTNSQMSETGHPLANSKNQIRKAIAATSAADTNNHPHLSHLSQQTSNSTTELIKFFYDDPELPYRPLPPHSLEESACKSIIRIDNHSFYYCALHPDVQSIYLESIEHHCKFKDGEMHHSEILKSLDIDKFICS